MKSDEGDPKGLARKARKVQGSTPKRAKSNGSGLGSLGCSRLQPPLPDSD